MAPMHHLQVFVEAADGSSVACITSQGLLAALMASLCRQHPCERPLLQALRAHQRAGALGALSPLDTCLLPATPVAGPATPATLSPLHTCLLLSASAAEAAPPAATPPLALPTEHPALPAAAAESAAVAAAARQLQALMTRLEGVAQHCRLPPTLSSM